VKTNALGTYRIDLPPSGRAGRHRAAPRAGQPQQPRAEVVPPAEALRRAHPLPRRDELVIEGVSEPDWAQFQQALTEA
jgi:hypothetical protein